MAGETVAEPAGPEPSAGGSVNSVKGFDRAAKLFDDLRAAGVDARPTPEGIELSGPTAALTPKLLDRLRTDRDELLAFLEWREERLAIADPGPAGADGGTDREPTAGGIGCPWCGPVDLRDDPEGLRCGRCERLAWVLVGRSMVRADCVEDDLEGLAPEDVPTCPSCGRWCDVETVVGTWRCTRCDGGAEEQRQRTLRVLERVARIRCGTR